MESSTTELKTEVFFDHGTADLTYSLCKRTYIEVNGEKLTVGDVERLGVVPGDIALVENFIYGELPARTRRTTTHGVILTLQAIWSDEVIEDYKAKIASIVDESIQNVYENA